MAINSRYGLWHNFILEKSPSGGPEADIHAKNRIAGDRISHLFQSLYPEREAQRGKYVVQFKYGSFMWDSWEEGIQVLLQASCECMLAGNHVFLLSKNV